MKKAPINEKSDCINEILDTEPLNNEGYLYFA